MTLWNTADSSLVTAATRAGLASGPADYSRTFEWMSLEYGRTMQASAKMWGDIMRAGASMYNTYKGAKEKEPAGKTKTH